MGFYNLNPDDIRTLQRPDPGDLLTRTGTNLPSVLEQLSLSAPQSKERVEEFLSKVVAGLRGVDRLSVGPMETLQFKQEVQGSPHPWRFPAGSMSDGTLRALGILVALFQGTNGHRHRIPLVGIEEPEVALHPAAAGVLLDALRLASRNTQVVVTSHSPELLDDEDIDSDSIFAVVAEKGESRIGPVDEASRKILRDGLYTAGELLRLNQLRPDMEEARRRGKQFSFFDSDD
jgi:predicted ATPase